jgi:hypothetical protein
MTPDELQQLAVRLYHELMCAHREAKNTSRSERAPIEARIVQIARDLKFTLDQHKKVTP